MLKLLVEAHFDAGFRQLVVSLLGDILGINLDDTALDHHRSRGATHSLSGHLGVIEQLRLIVHNVVQTAHALAVEGADAPVVKDDKRVLVIAERIYEILHHSAFRFYDCLMWQI